MESGQDHKEALAHSISTHSRTLHHLRRLHARAVSSGLRHNPYISTLLITACFNFADAATARLLFNTHPTKPPTPLLNSLIRGYLRIGHPRSALDAYHQSSGQCQPDRHTLHLVITACTRVSEFKLGSNLSEFARIKGLDTDLLVATAILTLFSNTGHLEAARNLFDRMPLRDVVSWNVMMAGYARAGLMGDAIALFRDMRSVHGVPPGEATFVSLIAGCGHYGLVQDGTTIHAHVIKTCFVTFQFVLNSLMAMYVEFNLLDAVEGLFDGMVCKDAISWSTMIGGYVRCDRPFDALRVFRLMVMYTGIVPTRPVLLNVLLACADLGDWREGESVAESYLNRESDASLVTALIYMYAKSGKLEVSLKCLDEDVRMIGDVVAWNVVMKACVELGHINLVLELALSMQRRSIGPDMVTFLTLLSVISSISSLRKGMTTHAQVIKRGFESEQTIANSLIDLYGKTGKIDESCKVYDGIQAKDVVSWSSMIKAYAWNGNADEALKLFQLMKRSGTRPNRFTFLALLSACSHVGLVEKGKELIEIMKKEYGLEPGIEHFTCLVDMFCRAGLFSEAYGLLCNEMMDGCISPALWGTLLSACRLCGESVIGEAAARNLFLLEPGNAANYLMLADIYVSAGRRDDANLVLRSMTGKEMKKRPSCSWLEGG